jgi:ABC-type transporter Mla MlaB component
MLRITRTPHRNRTTRLVLEGRIAGPWVGELRRVAAESARAGGRIALDLSSVTFADADGLALLRELLDGEAQLERASAFVTQLLQRT